MPVKWLKDQFRGIAESAGYQVIPSWRIQRYPQAEYLARLFQFCGITHVLDVGANRGQYHQFIRQEVGFEGEVISFEPNIDLSGELCRRASETKHWTVYDCALGAYDGRAEFNVMAGNEFSSFLKPDHSNVGLFGEMNLVEKSVSAEVKKLDTVLKGTDVLSSQPRIYLKLDTQGYDLEVLKGSERTLRNVCALQVEASVKPIYVGSPDYSEAIRQIQELGFELSAIYPNNDGHFPLLVEFDCHMIRRDLIPTKHLGKVDAS